MAPDPNQSAAAGGNPRGDLLERAVDLSIRLGRAWRALSWERRRAAVAALVLFVTLFLPWYQDSVVRSGALRHGAAPASQSLSGWAAFSVVQAGILILSLGLLFVLFLRAEGRASGLPGGDGWAVTVAGSLMLLLVVIGLFDAPTPAARGQYVVSTGLEWGIFVALVAAGALTYAGSRIRRSAARHTDPPEDDGVVFDGRWQEPGPSSDPPTPVPAPRVSASPRPAASVSAPPVSAPPVSAPPASAAESAPSEAPTRPAAPSRPGSRWRPADSPGWSEPERPTGWLTAPPKHLQEGPGSAGAGGDAEEVG